MSANEHVQQYVTRSKLMLTMAAAVILVLTAGCTSHTNGDYSGSGPKAQSYGNDGYLGLSNSNPRLVNRYGQQLNYKTDGGFAAAQLRTLDGVDKMSMSFQGPNLYVTLKPKAGVDEMKLRQRAIALLRYNMPRYTIHVNTVK
ncbi:hypothetical protein FHS18_006788 [Paenibacillus phyllosphaerae]|uniref:Sporulation protein n=1 Tax=Paenibacillus phyllosphaerae TaxID=274593 RepID=A0A7W5B587_9BACL|nr:hypothetical protein [Paenibacillus phyllosphaerae]MBB3114648.1 hypothetical protein [Paenibacillus phyllosphaerae]